MPIRWYGTGDKTDPVYLHFSRIVNLTIHFMAFSAINSGLWLVQDIKQSWPELKFFTLIWLSFLLAHLIFVIIKRPDSKDVSLAKEK